MAARILGARLTKMERCPASQPAGITYPELSPEDEEFFETMICRSIAGDRNWSEADRAKYHDMLLGEYPGARE